jgi:RHS repeat-associated protein
VQGVAVSLDVPSDGTTPPDYARTFALTYDNTAGNTLGGTFPGGQTSGFQGAWSDPITGFGFHRARWMDQRNAAWLSEDPLGNVDSPTLFTPLAWAPTTKSDPSGRYAKDFHYYVVYLLAYLAIGDQPAAERIAWVSQFVDNSSVTSPMTKNPEALIFHFLDTAGTGTPMGPENTTAVRLVNDAIQSRDEVRLGITLHTYADTFAHEGYTWIYGSPLADKGSYGGYAYAPAIGHLRAGHRPDYPFLQAKKAANAAVAIYDYISAFRPVPNPPAKKFFLGRDHLRSWLEYMFNGVRSEDEDERSEDWRRQIELMGIPAPRYSASGHPELIPRFSSAATRQLQRIKEWTGVSLAQP